MTSEQTPATIPTSAHPITPWDRHNQELLANVHPVEWSNPTPNGRYNVVVVGAGTAGLVSAIGAAALGARVALVERALMGGDCLNHGCVPSKALIRSSRAAYDAAHGEPFGARVPAGAVDFGAVMERMRRLRAGIARQWRKSAAARIARMRNGSFGVVFGRHCRGSVQRGKGWI